MSSARIVLLSLCSALLLRAALGAYPLSHFCSTSEKFTTSSPYESNLNKLTSFLYAMTPSSGFGLSSIGQYQDQVYGLVLCRAYTSPLDCKACLADAGAEIRHRCPRNKGAIIWYDKCMFKYLDADFFGQIDNSIRFFLYNLNNVEAAYSALKLYASGEVGLEGEAKLYGLVPCTRDLSATACKECPEGAIGDCCDGKEGGQVVGRSCNIGYEIYPFVNI